MSVNPRRRIQEVSQFGNRPRVFHGRLAEDYDGIGQYVLVNLSAASVSGAYKARVASGDFGTGQFFPTGTPVSVVSYRGSLEVISLGLKNVPSSSNLAACIRTTTGFAKDPELVALAGYTLLAGGGAPWEETYFDDNGYVSGGYAFVIPEDGRYEISFWLDITLGTEQILQLAARVYKNGSGAANDVPLAAAGLSHDVNSVGGYSGEFTLTSSRILQAVAGDTFDLRVRYDGASGTSAWVNRGQFLIKQF